MRKILFRALIYVLVAASFFLMPYASCAAAQVKTQASPPPCHEQAPAKETQKEKQASACCLVACCAPLPQVNGLRLPGIAPAAVAVAPSQYPVGVFPAPKPRPPSA